MFARLESLIQIPWWQSCLDHGALNNVDGCGTSVVRGATGIYMLSFNKVMSLKFYFINTPKNSVYPHQKTYLYIRNEFIVNSLNLIEM